jgi:hypothetical protein
MTAVRPMNYAGVDPPKQLIARNAIESGSGRATDVPGFGWRCGVLRAAGKCSGRFNRPTGPFWTADDCGGAGATVRALRCDEL